ncbi:hypothetical protein [Secundilactobacillus mixtipabuli]|uniref:Uncharacterized protein n=1 Tax=Secundilactobacillus mixtipabuli TaxID=1435342 RepID=A0A1Z5IF97_9LACO|nr:hypothetical protein [Secundilactobacillus mixtipabuli]GAX00262.1 hypothetical protein IWT30_02243 [Secundilactobacillus mixtipabuli]
MKQILIELFILLLTILLFLIGMSQFYQPNQPKSSLSSNIHTSAYYL